MKLKFPPLIVVAVALAIIGVYTTNTFSTFNTYCKNTEIKPDFKAKLSPLHKTFIDQKTKSKTQKRGEKIPQEWIELTHKASPEVDWRKVESRSISQLVKSRNETLRSNGQWIERGPTNVNGRITDIDLDFENKKMYCLSDHGIVFRSDLNGQNMTALNDQFPLAVDVAGHLKHFDGSNGNLIVSGWMKHNNAWGIFHSEDDGSSWQASAGFPINEITGIKRLATLGSKAYAFTQEYDGQNNTDYYRVYQSNDQGVSFSLLYQSKIPAGDGYRYGKSDMWISNNTSDPDFFLLLEDSLFSVNKNTGMRTLQCLVAGNQPDIALLSGQSKNGVIELRIYQAFGDNGNFYSWSSIAPNSAPYQGQLTDWWLSMPFGNNSFSCSSLSADTLYFGSILASKSTDGGQTWSQIDMDPTNSYARYHGDVPKILSIIHSETQAELLLIGTDGGMYKWNETALSFDSVGVPGLNTTQIYKMVSNQEEPGKIYIGTQDNGYNFTHNGATQQGAVDFTHYWGGDVSSVGSGDGGQTFWLWWLGDGCNYMTDATNYVSVWDPYQANGEIPYWEAPIWISNHFPNRCYTAGNINNTSGSYILKITANPGGTAHELALETNFLAMSGAKIAALAISPIDSNYYYVATENGRFYSSADGGNSWSSPTLLASWMYPREIMPSRINLGEVWVGGSGYSNAPVFYSDNHGNSFSSFDNGMLACRVNAFALNNQETYLYAATSIGPYACDLTTGLWENIAGTTAPINEYMDVEFIEKSNVVRFATYARGVWDFAIAQPQVIEDYTQDQGMIYPNPVKDHLIIYANALESGFAELSIIDINGKLMKQEWKTISNQKSVETNVDQLPSGTYLLMLKQGKNLLKQKFVINH